ncbi:MAG: hypothetical protein M1819_005388 [Sarea resinae]|nr:MAG: hypothetical protein M1819_005388 [Sarea resinae]
MRNGTLPGPEESSRQPDPRITAADPRNTGDLSAPIPIPTASSSSTHRSEPSPKASRTIALLRHLQRFKFRKDIRSRLPLQCARFLGYRPRGVESLPYEPLPFPPFSWLHKIPLRVEVWIFAWLGAFGSILIIEAVMSTSTAFRDVYRAPLITVPFGASAVLVFGVIESPLAQPRNLIIGHFAAALVGTAITRLFVLNGSYMGHLDNEAFHPATFINGGLSMATSLLAQLVLGCAHPPGGATGLNAAVQSDIVRLSWRYIPTVIVTSLLMLGWALVINNLGRRRYPIYWLDPTFSLVGDIAGDDEAELERIKTIESGPLRRAEDGGLSPEVMAFAGMEHSISLSGRRHSLPHA